MFARKKLAETKDPSNRGAGPKKGFGDGPVKGGQARLRKGVIGGQAKRSAFGDLTNSTKDQPIDDGKQQKFLRVLKPSAKGNVNVLANAKTTKTATKKKPELVKERKSQEESSQNSSTLSGNSSSSASASSSLLDHISSSQESVSSKNEHALKNLAAGVPEDRIEEDFSFVIVDDSDSQEEDSILSVDRENYTDVFNVGIYAQAIFEYYKRREKMFRIPSYLNGNHCHITPLMRAILVDWMVEIQENFEMNHETLYLAVKLTDTYLSRVAVDKEMLQLVGAAAVFIASKFDERCPPLIEDFTYICDNAFDRDQFIQMEMEILRTVDFDLGIPISYRFLRRYAKASRMSMETLTLARYILEMSLMEYALVSERDSMMAAAALYIAMKMRKEGAWEGEVVKASGSSKSDLIDLIKALNKMLLACPLPQLSTIRCKYSHIVFHEVAKIPPLQTEELLS